MSVPRGPFRRDPFPHEVALLDRRLRGWTGRSWEYEVARASGVTAGTTRADRVAALAGTLAELGREAGSGAPVGAVPQSLAPHGLADQIIVLAADLSEALDAMPADLREPLARRALEAVRAARTDLDRRR